jgi:hypothetical protein
MRPVHNAVQITMSLKNSGDTVGNQTCDPLSCSAEPQPNASPRARYTQNKLHNLQKSANNFSCKNEINYV